MKSLIIRLVTICFIGVIFGLAYAGLSQTGQKNLPHNEAKQKGFQVIKNGQPQVNKGLNSKAKILHPLNIKKQKSISLPYKPAETTQLRRWEKEQVKRWREYLVKEGWVNPDGSQKYIPGEVIVQFKNRARALIKTATRNGMPVFGIQSIDKINKKYRAVSIERVIKPETIKKGKKQSVMKHGLDLIYLIKFPSAVDVKKISEEYLKDPVVKEASPNWQLYPMNIPQYPAPNDPYYTQTPWSWDEMKCREAWYLNTGSSGVKVCHIALGPASNPNIGAHPDYNNQDLDLNYAGSGGGNAGSATTHATACAGCMAAENNNGYGQCGVAGGWGSTHGCTWTYYGMRNTTAAEIAAFKWGADNGCIVENASFGGTSPGAGVEAAVNYAVDNGCLVTASSGNADYPEISYPAYFGNAIAVGATQSGDENIYVYGPWIECLATGGQYSIGYEAMAWGTSFSAPKAAGVIGLIKSEHPGWNVNQIRTALTECADWIDYVPANEGRSGLMGGGRVNPYESMKVFDKNVSVNKIYRPQVDEGDSIDAYSRITPKVVVQNRGIHRETFKVICRIDTITGANVYADTVFVEGLADRTDKINKGRLISFQDWIVGGPSSRYIITAYTTLNGDQNLVNDTLIDTVYVRGGAAGVWLKRDDGNIGFYGGTGGSSYAYTTLMPQPAAACSIIAIRCYTSDDGTTGGFTAYIIPDSAGQAYRYAPKKTASAWVSKFVPNSNINPEGWTVINLSGAERIYWTPDSGFFHITVIQDAGNLYMGVDQSVPYKDDVGYFSQLGTNPGWSWGYWWTGQDPGVIMFEVQVKYITYNNDVSTTEIISPAVHIINQVPVIPQAVVKNIGAYSQSNFNVTMKIDSAGNEIYTDTKTVSKTLNKYESDTLTFTGWSPNWEDGTYNLRCYTQLSNDEDRSNDTLYQDVLTNSYDTLAYDDNSPYWIYTDNNCYWAVTFYPARACTVIGIDYMLYVGGSPHACTLFAYEAENDTPTVRLWRKTAAFPINGWNTYDFSDAEKIDRPNAEDFSLGLWTYGLQGGDTICPRFDNTDEQPYHSYANNGSGWGSPMIYDMMLRARVKYYGSPYDHDVGVTSLDNPVPYDWVYPDHPITPQVTVENFGLNSETFNVIFLVLDSLGAVEFADTTSTTLGPAETQEISFSSWTPQVPDMDYTIKGYTNLSSDQNRSNDTTQAPVYCRTINVISYNEETWGDLGVAEPYYAVRFTPERRCTVWGALINIWPNRDNCTAPCTLFLWADTLNHPASATFIDTVCFTPNSVGATQGGYIYRVRLDFTSGSKGSNYETDSDFWLGVFAPVSGADTVLVPFSDFADYENIDGRSLSNSDRTNTDQWYAPTWVSGSDTSQADWEIKALVKYLSYPDDAPLAPDLRVSKQTNDALLTWDSVKTDVSGNPIICDHYTIYRATNPNFTPGYNNFLSAGPDTFFTDPNVLDSADNYYYINYAFNKYGTKSSRSNMGYVFHKAFVENPSATDKNWTSLPWYNEYTTVSDLTTDLSPSGDPLVKITNLRDDQLYESYTWTTVPFPHWAGTDFAITSGRGYEFVTIVDTFWNPTEFSNLALARILARKPEYSGVESHLGKFTTPGRGSVWMISPSASRTKLKKEIEDTDPSLYCLADRDLQKEINYREPGISHLVRGYFELSGCDGVVFTVYRPGLPEDPLTERMIGCGYEQVEGVVNFWFDVGNFCHPWCGGEEVLLIVEALKGDRAYFGVFGFELDPGVDIQELGELRLVPISSSYFDSKDIIGYSLYRGGERLNTEIIKVNAQSTSEGLVMRPVIRGGYETVYSSGEGSVRLVPVSYAFSVFPNPFVKRVCLKYALPRADIVEIKVYDVCGKLIKTLVSGKLDPGYYQIYWNGNDNTLRKVPSGVYFCRITSHHFHKTVKLITIK